VRKLRWVPLILLVLFVVEFAVYWWVGQQLTFGWATLLIVVLSLAGGYLLKREGVRAWRRIRAASQATTPPGVEVLDGAVGLAAALLLFVPGFLTAAVGLLLLIPVIRRAARGGVRRITERKVNSRVAGDLFGPRQVKVRRGRAQTVPAEAGPAPADAPGGGADAGHGAPVGDSGARPYGGAARPGDGPGEVIEGEIVD
jgi:UPF0716 protein FxsA